MRTRPDRPAVARKVYLTDVKIMRKIGVELISELCCNSIFRVQADCGGED